MVIKDHGMAKWVEIKELAGMQEDRLVRLKSYPDKLTYDLVGAASKVLGADAENILKAFGEHKGDKVSIGGQNSRNHLFKDTTMQLQLGDLIYMATDGVTDQFGGNNDKKYGRPRLRNIIGNMVKQPFELQRHKFHQHLEDWCGNKEQVDDKTLLGIRYSPKVSHK